MLIYRQENSCRQNCYHSLFFQIQKPKGHIAIILMELARGTHLLFSLYAFSHVVPFYHLPSGFGCFISHCLDKAWDAWLPAEDEPHTEPGHHWQWHWDRLAKAHEVKKSRNPQKQSIFAQALMKKIQFSSAAAVSRNQECLTWMRLRWNIWCLLLPSANVSCKWAPNAASKPAQMCHHWQL